MLAHTEVSAALMACAEAELTGVPGVVVVGNGPGLASVVNGVAHAWLDRVPLFVISDRYTEAEPATTGHQILDQRALLAPVVKWSATRRRVVERRPRARRGAGRPVRPGPPRHAPHGRGRRERGRARNETVSRSRARRRCRTRLPRRVLRPSPPPPPVILAGLEAARILSAGDLAALAERLGAPVLTTYKAKGVLDEAHPLWAGIVTGGAIEAPLLDEADAILAVGLDPVELLTKPWPWVEPIAVRAEDVPALAARLPQLTRPRRPAAP